MTKPFPETISVIFNNLEVIQAMNSTQLGQFSAELQVTNDRHS